MLELRQRQRPLSEIAQAERAVLPLRGSNLRLQASTEPEIILSGPSETGKTIAALTHLDTLARATPHMAGAIVRKVRADMDSTVLKTWRERVLRPDVRIYGGEKPEWFGYPSGARIYVGGIDRPGSVLSGELDMAVVNQAEELALADWEILTTRTTGRAGHLAHPQLIGDCNPGPPLHWIKQRAQIGQILLWESRHEDNPILFTDDGAITEQGQRTLSRLDALTGVRKQRLRFGLWVQAEGAVYDFDPAIHVIDAMPEGWEAWRKVRAVDFGFTNPFVCQWWAIDGDGRAYLYREIYMTGRTVRAHAANINQFEVISNTITDHDAEDRATLEESGIYSMPAKKEISVGIQKVQERLAQAADGIPRLFILRGALVERDESLAEAHKPVCTEQEFESYSWPKGADGRAVKEVPIDLNNHGMDAMRYMVMHEENPIGQLFYE